MSSFYPLDYHDCKQDARAEIWHQLSIYLIRDITWLICDYLQGKEIIQLSTILPLNDCKQRDSCKLSKNQVMTVEQRQKGVPVVDLVPKRLECICEIKDKMVQSRYMTVEKIGRNRVALVDCLQDEVQIFDLQGKFLKTWDTRKHLTFPRDVALIKRGQVAIADSGNRCIKVFSTKGKFLVQWQSPLENKQGEEKEGKKERNKFFPVAIRKISKNLVAVADFYSHCIDIFTIKGVHITTWSFYKLSGDDGAKMLNHPSQIIKLKKNRIAILSEIGSRLQIVNREGQWVAGWTKPEGEEEYRTFTFTGVLRTASGDGVLLSNYGQHCNLFKLVVD